MSDELDKKQRTQVSKTDPRSETSAPSPSIPTAVKVRACLLPHSQPDPLSLPQTMDDFEILKVLGKGTFGKVIDVGMVCF